MRGIIVLLSGRMGSGKSTLAHSLQKELKSCTVRSTSQMLKKWFEKQGDLGRDTLQNLGWTLDVSNPQWILDGILSGHWVTIVDSIRNVKQVALIRSTYGSAHKILHIHLSVSRDVSRERRKEVDEVCFSDKNEMEDNMRSLDHVSDVSIFGGTSENDERWSKSDVHNNVMAVIKRMKRLDVILGGQYGSEGKGHIVSYLSARREYELVVRSGGPNAGHKVNYGGQIFTFFHIPSAALHNPDAICYIDKAALINPVKFLKELHHLRELLGGAHPNLKIHPDAFIIEKKDIELEESSVKGSIGSTAQGVGAALARRIMRPSDYRTAEEIPELRPYIGQVDVNDYDTLLEGTQGCGLDIYHGHYPYTTSRMTGSAALLGEIGVSPKDVGQIWGVFRTHPIRVQSPVEGTSGPMENEITLDHIHRRSGIAMEELERTETTSTTFRKRRIAEFDVEQYKRSMRMNGITHVAFTFMDYLGEDNRNAKKLEDLNESAQRFLSGVGLGPDDEWHPDIVSCGFDHKLIIDSRGR